MITPDRLAYLLGRRTPPAEPKPDRAPAPEPALPTPEPDPTEPTPTHYETAYTEIDQHREDITLDELIALTDQYGPHEAAMKLFGGQR